MIAAKLFSICGLNSEPNNLSGRAEVPQHIELLVDHWIKGREV